MKEISILTLDIELSLKSNFWLKFGDIFEIPLMHLVDIGYGFPYSFR